MKTKIIIENNITTLELNPEYDYEKNICNDFPRNVDATILKEKINKNIYCEDNDNKLLVVLSPAKRIDQDIDEVGELYESLKKNLNTLFADMQPHSSAENIGTRVTDVFNQLTLLRDLAYT